MSESTAAATAQAELPHPETGIMRGSAVMDSCPTSNHHHIISTESSVVSSSNTETGLKKPSSGASTATTSSGMGTSSSTDKLPVPQDNSKTRTPIVLQMNAPHHPVAEFLFQLTKMLTDDNKEYIEWRRASIFVTDPPGLENYILPKYFRHSNYSSFQRQMNYFGFRKIAGKGKMAPCSYVNENAKEDISSLLFIKRKKAGVSNKAAAVFAQHPVNPIGGMHTFMLGRPGLPMGGLNHSSLLSMGGGNHQMMPSHISNNSFNEASLYREQQQMLAQLQRAHASASNDSGLTAPSSGLGGQSNANSSFGSNIFSSGLQTTDQGSVVYNSSTDNSDWNTQQAHQLRANNAPQGNGGMGIDSSANLRALLNQQISYFNNFDSSAATTVAPGTTIPPNLNQIFAMPPNSSLFNDQTTPAPAGSTSSDNNEALIRQLEQQLFEAQTVNGNGLMGIPRGNGN